MIDSFFETLASVLEAGCWVSLTTIDRQGDVHTCPARALRGPFRGQIWLRLGREPVIDGLYDGTEATVSFSGAGEGPYVTVKGWAVRLPAEDLLPYPGEGPGAWIAASAWRRSAPLICVTATAAQLWESLSGGDPRVFAFPASDSHRVVVDSSVHPSTLAAPLHAAAEQST